MPRKYEKVLCVIVGQRSGNKSFAKLKDFLKYVYCKEGTPLLPIDKTLFDICMDARPTDNGDKLEDLIQ